MQLMFGVSWAFLGLLVIFFLVLFRRRPRVALALLLVLGGAFGFLIMLRAEPAARVERLVQGTNTYPLDPREVAALEAQEQLPAQMEVFATEMGAEQNALALELAAEHVAPAAGSQPAGAAVVTIEGNTLVLTGVRNERNIRDVAARATAHIAERLDELAQPQVANSDTPSRKLHKALQQLNSAQRRAVAAQAVAARGRFYELPPDDRSDAAAYRVEVPADELTNLARQMRLQTLVPPGGGARERFVVQVVVLVGVLVVAAVVLKAAAQHRRTRV